MLGTIAVSSNTWRNGAFVRIEIHASAAARKVAAAPSRWRKRKN
jgi:hypothetical protein